MANKPGDILLGLPGQEILLSRFGRSVKEGIIEISKEERTASGRLVKDIIATKKKFTISYSSVFEDDIFDIRDLYYLGENLSLIMYGSAGTSTSYTVRLAPLDMSREFASGTEWIYSGVSLSLEEV